MFAFLTGLVCVLVGGVLGVILVSLFVGEAIMDLENEVMLLRQEIIRLRKETSPQKNIQIVATDFWP